jgi:predicted pyridoxine 5'-phosphate oxidase superfamily flavin-nucleotide-binding protein
MARKYTQLTFTDSVKDRQEHYGTREMGRRMETMAVVDDRLSPREIDFIEGRDSFYVASVGENGWPYVQFRGGPSGFLKVLDDRTIAWADFRGNRQYVTTGNVFHDDRMALILMDYVGRKRLKIMARARIVDAAGNPDLIARLADPAYDAVVERAVVLTIEAFDWNCPQHITQRYTVEELHELESRSDPSRTDKH